MPPAISPAGRRRLPPVRRASTDWLNALAAGGQFSYNRPHSRRKGKSEARRCRQVKTLKWHHLVGASGSCVGDRLPRRSQSRHCRSNRPVLVDRRRGEFSGSWNCGAVSEGFPQHPERGYKEIGASRKRRGPRQWPTSRIRDGLSVGQSRTRTLWLSCHARVWHDVRGLLVHATHRASCISPLFRRSIGLPRKRHGSGSRGSRSSFIQFRRRRLGRLPRLCGVRATGTDFMAKAFGSPRLLCLGTIR